MLKIILISFSFQHFGSRQKRVKDPKFWTGAKFVCINESYPVRATVTLINEEKHLTEFHKFSDGEDEVNVDEEAQLDRIEKKIPALADASFKAKRPGAFPVCLDRSHEPSTTNMEHSPSGSIHPNNGSFSGDLEEWDTQGRRRDKQKTTELGFGLDLDGTGF